MLTFLRFLIFAAIVVYIFRFLQRLLRSFVNSGNQNPPQDAPPPSTPPPIDMGDVKDASFQDIHDDEKPA
ncbi:MAG: hypothetical protein WD182_05720 [Bacteroidota bacterium]